MELTPIVDGFIVVDLPPEEGAGFVSAATKRGLTYVPLVSPTSTNERIAYLSSNAGSFMYCVSVTGVTGDTDPRGRPPAPRRSASFPQQKVIHRCLPFRSEPPRCGSAAPSR